MSFQKFFLKKIYYITMYKSYCTNTTNLLSYNLRLKEQNTKLWDHPLLVILNPAIITRKHYLKKKKHHLTNVLNITKPPFRITGEM